jgi:hypothetical protein
VFVEEREHLGQLRVEGADLLDGRLAETCRQAAGTAEGLGDLRRREYVSGDLDGPAEELVRLVERDRRERADVRTEISCIGSSGRTARLTTSSPSSRTGRL